MVPRVESCSNRISSREDIMTKTLHDAVEGLKTLSGKQGLSPVEKDMLQQVTGALSSIEKRLATLEGEDHSASAPISDTPQGETAPLSR
jgi:hypothetical protein